MISPYSSHLLPARTMTQAQNVLLRSNGSEARGFTAKVGHTFILYCSYRSLCTVLYVPHMYCI